MRTTSFNDLLPLVRTRFDPRLSGRTMPGDRTMTHRRALIFVTGASGLAAMALLLRADEVLE